MLPLTPYKPQKYPPKIGNWVQLASPKLGHDLDEAHETSKSVTNHRLELAVERKKEVMQDHHRKLVQYGLLPGGPGYMPNNIQIGRAHV